MVEKKGNRPLQSGPGGPITMSCPAPCLYAALLPTEISNSKLWSHDLKLCGVFVAATKFPFHPVGRILTAGRGAISIAFGNKLGVVMYISRQIESFQGLFVYLRTYFW